ncbi:alkylation response protein AidB-like acyl-CoA dehydrogenase [Actinoalloteichus hoggarensis]|uniref:Flavin-dependent monooxygenase, oxygenase subunit HsaA n=1 Tax=Actinoalloteichus hoggarensis TaxID=1470176 RepID=A0A221W5Q3_9PSEU|nr:acyl-CoA dehydrogenase family protein [Actinoalloteichus hoggarensis]ASO20929.1 Flavin-dependent monooxygenase, oxygenase subunit HsaA [Actinoalloteichus hoggarensis]MBB5920859.1 alkylation response protein AidB-like acyl-CoA dehydrogenase [Actinoalloteichus hoggarensis]
MTSTRGLDSAELLDRASTLVPVLRRHALWQEENRRLHEETIQALTDSGLLRMRMPAHHGGGESDLRTLVDVLAELARGDGSTSWTVAVWAISTWMVGMFPDDVQDEVFATPDVRVSGILSPSAMATPTDGGVLLTGRWAFNSGATQSHWNTNAAVMPNAEGELEPIMTLIPLSDLAIIDDWHTAGLRGSGSVTTAAENLFVPQERVLPLGPVLGGRHRSVRNADSPMYRAPFMPTAATTVGATALGLAKAAKEAFFERLPGRKITYTSYDDQSTAPLTHLQVGEAVTKIDEAEFHARRAAAMVDEKGAAEEWTVEERARVRLDVGAVCLRAKEAVDVLNTASGGSSIYRDVPIQRIERDVQTLNLHAIMHPNTNLELYGRILCGLEPNTSFL